jgi:ribonuclease J
MTQRKQLSLRIIPLGGSGEVGRCMMVFEYGKAIFLVDLGIRMPEEDMPGIDYVIPNVSYLKGKEKNIVGLFLTHGHYDHIGAVPYLIEKIGNPPIYTAPLTKGLVLKRQEEFPHSPRLEIHEVYDGSRIRLGPFSLEFFRENHNIPDTLGAFMETPVGNVLYTSEFKFDPSPINEPPTNMEKLYRLAERKILLLISDSIGAENIGHSLSEATIFENLEEIFRQAKGRLLVATFSSLLNRIQQVVTLSEKYKRKVFFDGRTMKTNVEIARRLGYLKMQKYTEVQAKEIDRYPPEKITIMCTGAQGEGGSTLMRIATKEHPFIKLQKTDTIVFSSSIVPGNERTVQRLKDDLLRQGVKVFHYKMMDIHAGGHAQSEEIEEMIRIMRPKFFMPINGQYSMLVAAAELAKKIGVPEKNIVVAENGDAVVVTPKTISLQKAVAPANDVMVDGLGIGDVGEVVLRDRQALAKDGMFVIIAVVDKKTGRVYGNPDIISRGFVYLRESKELLAATRRKTIEIIHRATGSGATVNWSYLKDEIRNKISGFLFTKTKRRPMVLPVVIEV